MKIYLSGPMTGLPDMNFPAFNRAAKRLRDDGHLVFNPAEVNPVDGDYRTCMAVDLGWICAHASMLCVLPGWENSKGARAEIALAECLGLEVKLI